MVESKRAKALRYIAEERVTVTSANEHGIRLDVRGSKAEPYHVAYGTVAGKEYAQCSCFNGSQVYTTRPRCSHIEIARLLHRI